MYQHVLKDLLDAMKIAPRKRFVRIKRDIASATYPDMVFEKVPTESSLKAMA